MKKRAALFCSPRPGCRCARPPVRQGHGDPEQEERQGRQQVAVEDVRVVDPYRREQEQAGEMPGRDGQGIHPPAAGASGGACRARSAPPARTGWPWSTTGCRPGAAEPPPASPGGLAAPGAFPRSRRGARRAPGPGRRRRPGSARARGGPDRAAGVRPLPSARGDPRWRTGRARRPGGPRPGAARWRWRRTARRRSPPAAPGSATRTRTPSPRGSRRAPSACTSGRSGCRG